MSSRDEINYMNKCFLNGELPDQFNFSLHAKDPIDWDKIRYNAFYKSFEYAESKFPNGWESIPGFVNIIESCIPKLSPLEELELRNNEKEIDEMIEENESENFIITDNESENEDTEQIINLE